MDVVSEPGKQRLGLPVHLVEVEQRPAARLVGQEDALGDAQVRHEVELLVDRRDTALQRPGRVTLRERFAENRISPLVGSIAPETHLISVDLPAPFGPSRQCTSPSSDVEVDPLERLDSGELLDEVPDLEDGGHCTTSPRRLLWAIRRPASINSGEPPQTGSSCSTDRTPSNPPSYSVSM